MRCGAQPREIAIIGGVDIYTRALPITDRLEITEVHARIEGDTRFPPIDAALWQETGTDAACRGGGRHRRLFLCDILPAAGELTALANVCIDKYGPAHSSFEGEPRVVRAFSGPL